jgi:hypothetical protein
MIFSSSGFDEVMGMIRVSDLAAMVMVESLEASGIGPERGLRLKKDGEELSLQIDSPGSDDRVVWHNGAIALIVDKQLEEAMGDALIDVEDDPEEPYLAIRQRN